MQWWHMLAKCHHVLSAGFNELGTASPFQDVIRTFSLRLIFFIIHASLYLCTFVGVRGKI